MYPPIYQTCANNAGVTAVLGDEPNIWSHGEAPQGVDKPYATYQNVSGAPSNYLGDLPDTDFNLVQIDIYANSKKSCREVTEALRDAFEPIAHITRWGGEDRDPETNNYHFSFDINFITSR